jgi:hypothetical protein
MVKIHTPLLVVTQENSSCWEIHSPLLLKKTALAGRYTLHCYSRIQLLMGDTHSIVNQENSSCCGIHSIVTQENSSCWEIHSSLLLKKTARAGRYVQLYTLHCYSRKQLLLDVGYTPEYIWDTHYCFLNKAAALLPV